VHEAVEARGVAREIEPPDRLGRVRAERPFDARERGADAGHTAEGEARGEKPHHLAVVGPRVVVHVLDGVGVGVGAIVVVVERVERRLGGAEP